MRAIIGLVDGTPGDELSSASSKSSALDVQERQEYLDGSSVAIGRAATVRSNQYEGPRIKEDGSIVDTEHVYNEWIGTEWFADLHDAGFFAVDSSAGDFAFWMARHQADANIVEPNVKLGEFVSYLEERNATFEWLGWSDANEAGVYYPDLSDVDSNVQRRAMKGRKSHIGFEYAGENGYIRGAAARSGYVEVYSISTPEQMTRWLKNEFLQFCEIPKDPLAALLGGTDEDEEEEEQEEDDASQGTLDDLETVNDPGGEN